MKILGLLFDRKLNWLNHIKWLSSNLTKRLNILKAINGLTSEAHVYVLKHILKSLILSKIDYGLIIYGKTAKSNLLQIKKYYHAALRTITQAFYTTPIMNILQEFQLPTIEDRFTYLLCSQIIKISQIKTIITFEDSKGYLTSKRRPRIKSAIACIHDLAKQYSIDLNNPPFLRLLQPTWTNKSNFILEPDIALNNNGPNAQKLIHLQISDYWKKRNWIFWYTDGSKSSLGNAFAIVTDEGQIIKKGLVPPYTSIFTSEITAIANAIISKPQNKKLIICSDSLSSINAIKSNSKEPLITYVRELLLRHKNIKLLYTPAHIGIRGNELADKASKETYI